jgi:hypothetical protein
MLVNAFKMSKFLLGNKKNKSKVFVPKQFLEYHLWVTGTIRYFVVSGKSVASFKMFDISYQLRYNEET